MHIFCSVCKEYLADVDPLDDESVVEGLCPQCKRKLIQESQLAEKPIRHIGFIQDEPKKKPPKQ